ncbi:MAG: hypothetical protein RQ745_04430 [Longimicrobiales bacterium]|nr:hypothetical protein [Longimicrobiales bacterium]
MDADPNPDTERDVADDDRRAFLFKVARGMAWSVPVIRTLAAPESLHAINFSRFMMGMGMGMRFGLESAPSTTESPFPGNQTTEPPWATPPPGGGAGNDGRE